MASTLELRYMRFVSCVRSYARSCVALRTLRTLRALRKILRKTLTLRS